MSTQTADQLISNPIIIVVPENDGELHKRILDYLSQTEKGSFSSLRTYSPGMITELEKEGTPFVWLLPEAELAANRTIDGNRVFNSPLMGRLSADLEQIREGGNGVGRKVIPLLKTDISDNEFLLTEIIDFRYFVLGDKSTYESRIKMLMRILQELIEDHYSGRSDSFPSPRILIEQELALKTGTLNLHNCGLLSIPEEVLRMTWLTSLQLGKAETDPPILQELSSMIANEITSLVPGISGLKALQSLNLEGNRLDNIKLLADMTGLVSLDLAKNAIEDIRPLASLKALKWLSLFKNRVSDISPLAGLENLEYLRLSSNDIEDISPLRKLHNISRLRLSDNKIKDLSPLHGHIERGLTFVNKTSPGDHEISVVNNPLPVTEVRFIMGGRESYLSYILSLQENLTFSAANIQKVILLGNSNSGKTTLRKYLKKEEGYKVQKTTTKLEVEKMNFEIEGRKKPIELCLLDFGGQEYFHGTYHLFFSLDTLYIIVWSGAENKYKPEPSREEFDGGGIIGNEDFDVAYWLNTIDIITAGKNSYLEDINAKSTATAATGSTEPPVNMPAARDIPVLLVQNKVDLDGLVYEDIKMFGDEFNRFNLDTVSVSLHGGLRLELLKKILEQKIKDTGALEREMPDKWNRIIEELRQKHLGEKIIDCSVFNTVCRKHFKDSNTFSEQYFAGIGKYFHAVHEFIYFGDIGSGIIVLDTEWFVNSIYTLISGQRIYNRKGILTESEIKEVIDPEFKRTGDFIEILRQKNILFVHDQSDPAAIKYILPQMLPVPDAGADKLLFESFEMLNVALQFRYHLHRSTIHALFHVLGQCNTDAEFRHIYKNGIIIKKVVDTKVAMVFLFINQELKRIEFRTMNHSPVNDLLIKEIIFTNLTDPDHPLLNKLPLGKDRPWLCIRPDNSMVFIPIAEIEAVARDIEVNKKASTISYKNAFYDLIEFSPFTYLMNPLVKMPRRLFISYSHKDTDVFNVFVSHLQNLKNQGYISAWHDQMLLAGDKWDQKIINELKRADIVIFMLSQDFINSKYIQEKEFREAITGVKTIVPIKVRSCDCSVIGLDENQFAIKVPLLPSSDLEAGVLEAIGALRKTLTGQVV